MLCCSAHLAHDPVGNTAVGRDREEVELLGQVLGLPENLPHGVGVLSSLDRGGVDGPHSLVPDVVDHDGSVVAANGQERRVLGVEVQAHDAALGGEDELGVRGVLQRVAANHPAALAHEVVGAVAHREEIGVLGVPAECCDLQATSDERRATSEAS